MQVLVGRSEKTPCFLTKAAERKRAAKFPTGSQPCVSKSAGFAARRFILDMEYVLWGMIQRFSAFVGQSVIKTSKWRGIPVRWNGQKHIECCMAKNWQQTRHSILNDVEIVPQSTIEGSHWQRSELWNHLSVYEFAVGKDFTRTEWRASKIRNGEKIKRR